MKWGARILVLVLMLGGTRAGGFASASVGKPFVPAHPALRQSPGTRPAAMGARATRGLAGYVVVENAGLTATNETQSYGAVPCPRNTVVYGGGVFISSRILAANVNSSGPNGDTGWQAEVNNASGADTTFDVYAICAKAPRGYAVVESSGLDNPAGSQSTAVAECPARTKVLGGGGSSSSGDVRVNMNTSIPEMSGPRRPRYYWRADMNNASASDATVYAWAVCGKTKGYGIQQGPDVDNPSGEQSFTSVACPGTSLPLGGGIYSASGATDVDTNSTYPDPGLTGWGAWESNGNSVDNEIAPYAICAGT